MASAWAMQPPTVPRLRIDTWPIIGSASARTGGRSATSGDRSASRSRVRAPMATPSPSSGRMPARLVDAR